MQDRRGRMAEELRTQERARDLLKELERRLKGEVRPDLEQHLTQLDELAGSFPEAHVARLLIESAVGFARTARSARASSDVSRSRSGIEGEISTLRGHLERGPN